MEIKQLTLEQAEPLWREWELSDATVSPFAYFDYMSFRYRELQKWHPLTRPCILALYSDQGQPLMIAPLSRQVFRPYYKMMMDIQGSAAAQFLFAPGMSDAESLRCIETFFAQNKGKYKLSRIMTGNILATYLHEHAKVKSQALNVTCPLVEGMKCRRNLNTKYNRLKRDNIEWEVKFIEGCENLTDDVWADIMALYTRRLFSRYKRKKGPVLTFYRWKYYHVKHDTFSLRHCPNSLHCLLYFNGRLVAFMSNLLSHDRTMMVMPRIAMDDEMYFYSPGYILINETIRHLLANTTVREIDMTRGNETYKYDFGGQEHFTETFKFRV